MVKILLTSSDPDPSHLSSLTSHPSQTPTSCLHEPDLCVAAHVHAHTPCDFRPPRLGTACPLCLQAPSHKPPCPGRACVLQRLSSWLASPAASLVLGRFDRPCLLFCKRVDKAAVDLELASNPGCISGVVQASASSDYYTSYSQGQCRDTVKLSSALTQRLAHGNCLESVKPDSS